MKFFIKVGIMKAAFKLITSIWSFKDYFEETQILEIYRFVAVI